MTTTTDVIQLHAVDPATRFDLIDDDSDHVIVGFDFAEFQTDNLSLWVIEPDDAGSHEVAIIRTVEDASSTRNTAIDLLRFDSERTVTFLTGRVSFMAPFGAPRMSVAQIEALVEYAKDILP